jgi:GNAT superfamily N-acetyltransferase
MTLTMRIARARDTGEDLEVVFGLIENARHWLRTKGTDQWERPWPDLDSRNARVLRGVQRGRTWIVWEGTIPAATVTIATKRNTEVWSKQTCACDLSERAVFVHRLITARSHAGLGLGAELIDWAGLRGRRDYGAKWIRIDVWSSNTALHEYYLDTGFERCGRYDDPGYPSGALFQKRVSGITERHIPVFAGSSAEFVLPAAPHAVPAAAPIAAGVQATSPVAEPMRMVSRVPAGAH